MNAKMLTAAALMLITGWIGPGCDRKKPAGGPAPAAGRQEQEQRAAENVADLLGDLRTRPAPACLAALR